MSSDGDDTMPPPAGRPRRGCGWFAAGFLVAGFLGVVLAFVAFRANAPMWVAPVAFLAPQILYSFVAAALFFPRVMREMREAARNAPSPERVAAAARGRGVEVGTKIIPPAGPDDTPTVPVVPTHPGRTLPFRLERADVPASCQFGCAVLAAVFWNGIVSVFVFQLAKRWNRGGVFRWFEAAFLVPFALVGLALVGFVVYAGYKLFVSALVGRVVVELDEHPLVPGGAGHIRIAQTGLFPLARVRTWLVCTEEASYMAGTTKSTAREEVGRHPVADPDQDIDGGRLPLEAGFRVPADAMHSFAAPNNAIKWTVMVTGRVLGLPFSDVYEVGVTPGRESGIRNPGPENTEPGRDF
jgi:hypothetical protein